MPLVLLLLPPGQPSIQTNFLLRRHPAQELKKCTDKIYRLSLSPQTLYKAELHKRRDALTEKYAANPHPSSCYILSTHHKYRCSSTFLKQSTESRKRCQFAEQLLKGLCTSLLTQMISTQLTDTELLPSSQNRKLGCRTHFLSANIWCF